MRMRLALLLIPMLALSAAKNDPLAGRIAGAPVECLADIDTRSQAQILDGTTIAYSRTAQRVWITHPQGQCPALRPTQTLVVERRGARLCAGDRFRIVQTPARVPSAFCRFGTFTPYDMATR